MTIQPLIPTSLPWVYDLIVGQEWPQGDEDALRRCAQAWTEALGGLVGIADGGNAAANVVGYSVQAVSSDEFDKYWSRYTKGDDSVVGQMAQQCQGLAELLLQDAEQVEFTKLSINIQVVILAIQLTIDIATAIVTAGSSMAEGAAAATAARFTVKKLLMELLKGALMAAAPDFITQTIMLAEGHRSSYDVNETLQAAGQGALGAGIGMAVGGVTGKLASSLTEGLGEDAAKGLGGKLLTGTIHAGNAAITGALTNMVTTGVTDVATGQSLDNVWSAGANGAANGLLFHGAHALGERIGESVRPEPTHFSLAGGGELHGLPLKDGSFALFDPKGMKHGTGYYDPQSGQLSVRPVNGEPYRVSATAGDQQTPGGGQHGGAGGAGAGSDGGTPSRGPEPGPRGEPGQGPEVPRDPAPPRQGPEPGPPGVGQPEPPGAPRQGPEPGPPGVGQPDPPGPPRQEPPRQGPEPGPPGVGQPDPPGPPRQEPPHQEPEPGPPGVGQPEPPRGEPAPPDPPRQEPGPTPEPSPHDPAPPHEPVPPLRDPGSPHREPGSPRHDPTSEPPAPGPTPEPPRGEPVPVPGPPRQDPRPGPPGGDPSPAPEPPGRVRTPEPPRDVPGPTSEPSHGGSGPAWEPARDHQPWIPGPDPTSLPGEPNPRYPDPLSTGGASLASADPIGGVAEARPEVPTATPDPAFVQPSQPAPAADPAAADLGMAAAATSAAASAMDGGRASEPSQRSASPQRPTGNAEASPTRSSGNSMLDAIRAAAEPITPEPRTAVIPEPAREPEPARKPEPVSATAPAGEPGPEFASLGEGPAPDKYVPYKDPTPAVGKWTENDEHWRRIANDPVRLGQGKSLAEILTRWHNGEAPLSKVTAADMRAAESKYIADHPDDGRKAFHYELRDELDRRHQVVKGDLDRIRNDVGFGEFRGEDHYRKLAESLDRKLDGIPGLSFQEFLPGGRQDWAGAELNAMALDVNDPLRYTLVFDDSVYARGAHDTLRALHERGYQLLDEVTLPDGTKVPGHRPLLENDRLPEGAKFAKNFWRDGNRYLGMNITLVDPHGGPFELQFHTPESFDVKQQLSHWPYEIYRRPELSVESRVNSMLEMVGMSDHYLSGHVPEGLEEFAPRSKDAGLDKLFGDIRDDVQKQIDQAPTPERRARAEQQMAELEERRRSLMEANREELAAHLRRLGQDDLSPQEVGRLFGETVELVKAGERLKAAYLLKTGEPLNLDPAEVRRGHFTTPSYERAVHEATPAHEAAPAPHGENNDHLTGLGPSPHDPSNPAAAAHHPLAHLDDPIRISQDHLVFQMQNEHGDLAFAHLQRINDRWVLHSGGPEGEKLTAMGADLRTTPPGLDLIGHATPEGFLIGGKTVPFEDVLAHIPGASEDNSPIRLIACEAGGANGEAAQRLADLSGRKVIAADSAVWVSPDGYALASNPVDRATNWYPKIPPDGVWHEFEPGSHDPLVLRGDDPRLPQVPEGWQVSDAHLASATRTGLAQEFSDLGVKPNELPENVHTPEWEADAVHLGNKMGHAANLDFADEARKFLAGANETSICADVRAARQSLAEKPSPGARQLSADLRSEIVALRPEGLADAADLARNVYWDANDSKVLTYEPKSVVNGVEVDNKPAGKAFLETVSVAGIEVRQNIFVSDSSAPHPARVTIDFPDGRHSYDAICEQLKTMRELLRNAHDTTPDSSIARAVMDLLAEGDSIPDDAARRRGIELLGDKIAANGGLDLDPPLTKEKIVAFGGALAHLLGHLEPARDPRALSILANLDVAAHGGMAVTDAVKFFNPVHQAGGARQAEAVYHRVERENPEFKGQGGKSFQEVKAEFTKKNGKPDLDYTVRGFNPLVKDFLFDRVWHGEHGDIEHRAPGPRIAVEWKGKDASGRPAKFHLEKPDSQADFVNRLGKYADKVAKQLVNAKKFVEPVKEGFRVRSGEEFDRWFGEGQPEPGARGENEWQIGSGLFADLDGTPNPDWQDEFAKNLTERAKTIVEKHTALLAQDPANVHDGELTDQAKTELVKRARQEFEDQTTADFGRELDSRFAQQGGREALPRFRQAFANRVKEEIARQLFAGTDGRNWAAIPALETEIQIERSAEGVPLPSFPDEYRWMNRLGAYVEKYGDSEDAEFWQHFSKNGNTWTVDPQSLGTADPNEGFFPGHGNGSLFEALRNLPPAEWRDFVHELGIRAGIDQTEEIQLRQRNALARFVKERFGPAGYPGGPELFTKILDDYQGLSFPKDYLTDAP